MKQLECSAYETDLGQIRNALPEIWRRDQISSYGSANAITESVESITTNCLWFFPK